MSKDDVIYLPEIHINEINEYKPQTFGGGGGDSDFSHSHTGQLINVATRTFVLNTYPPIIAQNVKDKEASFATNLKSMPESIAKSINAIEQNEASSESEVAKIEKNIRSVDTLITQKTQASAAQKIIADKYYYGDFFGYPTMQFIKDAISGRKTNYPPDKNYKEWYTSLEAAYAAKYSNREIIYLKALKQNLQTQANQARANAEAKRIADEQAAVAKVAAAKAAKRAADDLINAQRAAAIKAAADQLAAQKAAAAKAEADKAAANRLASQRAAAAKAAADQLAAQQAAAAKAAADQLAAQKAADKAAKRAADDLINAQRAAAIKAAADQLAAQQAAADKTAADRLAAQQAAAAKAAADKADTERRAAYIESRARAAAAIAAAEAHKSPAEKAAAAQLAALRAADQVNGNNYKDEFLFVTNFYSSLFMKYGQHSERFARQLAENAKGVKIRSAEEAMATFKEQQGRRNQYGTYAVDQLSKGIDSLDMKVLTKNLDNFGKFFGGVSKGVDYAEVLFELRDAMKTGDWKPLFLKLESMAVGGLATYIVAGIFGISAATPLGILAFALLMAATSAYVDDKLIKIINRDMFGYK